MMKTREQIEAEAREPARLRDILQRIETAWTALKDERGMGCDCGPPGTGEACDVCEITFLLELALGREDPEDGMTFENWMDGWEASVRDGDSTISREEAMRRWDQRQAR